jgi:hypothetical protein
MCFIAGAQRKKRTARAAEQPLAARELLGG